MAMGAKGQQLLNMGMLTDRNGKQSVRIQRTQLKMFDNTPEQQIS